MNNDKDPDYEYSVNAFIEGLNIMLQYLPKKFFMGAGHDVIHMYWGTDDVPEDSSSGKRICELGLFVYDEAWLIFV